MFSFANTLKNGVIYRHLRHPFSEADISNFFSNIPQQQIHTEGNITENIKRLVSEGKLYKIGAFPFYFFGDIPIPNEVYLATILKSLKIKMMR
jgi:hypothetical protein